MAGFTGEQFVANAVRRLSRQSRRIEPCRMREVEELRHVVSRGITRRHWRHPEPRLDQLVDRCEVALNVRDEMRPDPRRHYHQRDAESACTERRGGAGEATSLKGGEVAG